MANISDACGGMETGAGQEIKGAPDLRGLEPVELIGADANDFFDEVPAPDSVKQLYQDIDQSVDGLGTILQESLENGGKNKSDGKNYRKGSIVKWPIRYRIMAIPLFVSYENLPIR